MLLESLNIPLTSNLLFKGTQISYLKISLDYIVIMLKRRNVNEFSCISYKLYPTSRMDMTSLHMLCNSELKHLHWSQMQGEKYVWGKKMWPNTSMHASITQQDYYGRWCSTPLHSYCPGTYTEVAVLLLRSSSTITLEYPCRYFKRVAVQVLHGNSRTTSKVQHCYFCVGTIAATVQ